ncbi:unnamed protein product, partial [Prorocentrum cordatum]
MLRVKTECLDSSTAPSLQYDPDCLMIEGGALATPAGLVKAESAEDLPSVSVAGSTAAAGDDNVQLESAPPARATDDAAEVDVKTDERKEQARNQCTRMIDMLAFAGVAASKMTDTATPVDRDQTGEGDIATEAGAEAQAHDSKVIDAVGAPISDLSLLAALPSGPTMVAVRRIRKTINNHVEDMRRDSWFNDFKLGTVSSVGKRLDAHSDKILGKATYEVQLAYLQLQIRIRAVVSLWKAIKTWLESQNETLVIDTLPHFSTVLGYVATVEVPMSQTLTAVFQYAVFHADFKKCGVASAPITRLDTELFDIARANTNDEVGGDVEEVHVASDGEGKGEVADGEPSEKDRGSKPKHSKKAKKDNPDIHAVVLIGASAVDHMEHMIVEAMKGFMYKLPRDTLTVPEKRSSFVTEILDTVQAWTNMSMQFENIGDAQSDFTKVLTATGVIAQCVISVDQCRPPSSEVRAARKVVLDHVKGVVNPTTEQARILKSYTVSQDVLEASRVHVEQTVEDDTASEFFLSAVSKLEDTLESAFDDIEVWRDTMAKLINDTSDFAPLEDVYTAIDKLIGSVVHCLGKWSTAALHQNCLTVCSEMKNCKIIIDVALYMHLHCFYDGIAIHFGELNNYLATLIKAGGLDDPVESFNEKSAIESKVKLQKFMGAMKVSADRVLEVNTHWAQCLRMIVTRAGQFAMAQFDEDEMTTLKFDICHTATTSSINDMIKYAVYCIDVAVNAFAKVQLAPSSEAFIEFTRLSTHLSDIEKLSWECRCFCSIDELPASTVRAFMPLRDGTHVLETCKQSFFTQKLKAAGTTLPFSVGDVHEAAVLAAQEYSTIVLLTRGLDDVAVCIPDCLKGELPGTLGLDVFATAGHNVACEDLRKFVEASGATHVKVDGMTNASTPDDDNVPVQHSLAYISIVNAMKDIVGCIVKVNGMLFKASGYNDDMSEGMVVGPLVQLLKLVSASLVRLDCQLHSKPALELEKAGWVTPVGLSGAKQWALSVGHFSLKCQKRFLQIVDSGILQYTDACSKECLDWKAAFDTNGKLNLPLATKLFYNKHGRVAASHNALHQKLATANVAVADVDITPSIQEHDITSSSVALALACLVTRGSKGNAELWARASVRSLNQI